MSNTPIPSEIYETNQEQLNNSDPPPSIQPTINEDRMSGSSKIRRIELLNSPSTNSPKEIKNGDRGIPPENQIVSGEGFPSESQSPLGDSASQDASSQKLYWNSVNSTSVSGLE